MNDSLRISQPHADKLMRHLFPGDHDEHAAALLTGVVDMPSGSRFLVRDIVLAKDGVDFVPGTRGYRAMTADFVARVSHRCIKEKMIYWAVHCHGGQDSVRFSDDDLGSHKRGFPALMEITKGPVGALVFARNAAAGEVWRSSGVSELTEVTVVGPNLGHLFPFPRTAPGGVNKIYGRQSLLFGQRGQDGLRRAKVAIIGLGGAGSLVSQWLAHLGVGHIIGIDFDRLEPTNRPRVVGSTPWDAGEPLVNSRFSLLRRAGMWLSKYKVDIAKRTAKRANSPVRYDAIVGDILDEKIARSLRDVDYIFLCADGMRPRLVFNAIVHQFLIPGVQVGAKVLVDKESGDLLDVFTATRRVLPYAGGGCLSCNKMIPPRQLQAESLSPEEREAQRYVEDPNVTVPSVITLNARAASQATDDFLFGFQGLLQENAASGYYLHYPRERKWMPVGIANDPGCIHCGSSNASSYARGDNWDLPCVSQM